jgi:hypothetical protein
VVDTEGEDRHEADCKIRAPAEGIAKRTLRGPRA